MQKNLANGCVDFESDNFQEDVSMVDDDVLEQFLDNGELVDSTIQRLIKHRQVFPVFFGSALKMEGIEEFLQGIQRFSTKEDYPTEFGAKVFKISHDDNERLTWVKVTGGVLENKAVLYHDQKANQLRIYDGSKFALNQNLSAGEVCAITGLTDTYPGLGLGKQADSEKPTIQPVLNFALDPKKNDIHQCLEALRQLEDEDPQLHVQWLSHLQEIRIQVMGQVQLEIIQQLLLDRFSLDVNFGEGNILYKETITKPIEAVGHFEPLRHYSEVHLLLEPGPVGSGLQFSSNCSLDVLASNWQHQVLSNLQSKEHLGVLIGAPITDMKITLIGGKASNVHSVGGDFKEATWRAVRQGLMELRNNGSQLLEPWYQFRLEVPQDQVGHAMNDIQQMNGTFETPEMIDGSDLTIISGTAPVKTMQGYSQSVNSYTHGLGNLECVVMGYQACHNAKEVIESRDYDPVSDLENTPDSVFCAHGAGYPVSWNEVPQMAHVPFLIEIIIGIFFASRI